MSEQSLVKLKSQDLPVKVAYKLNKNIKAISERLRFINEHRKDFIEKYGRPDENGVFYIPSEDQSNIDKFMKDYTELLEIEDEIELEILPGQRTRLQLCQVYIHRGELRDYLVECAGPVRQAQHQRNFIGVGINGKILRDADEPRVVESRVGHRFPEDLQTVKFGAAPRCDHRDISAVALGHCLRRDRGIR